MAWTPASGTMALKQRMGADEARKILVSLLGGEVGFEDLLRPPCRGALLDVGDGHADRLMNSGSGAALAYWPRVWAARALAYLGDPTVGPHLIEAVNDRHWRVRMTSLQTIGRLGLTGLTPHLVPMLNDEHPRVRSSAVLALQRVGDERALGSLGRLSGQKNAQRAIAAILDREDAK